MNSSIANALDYISPDCDRSTWARTLMAIKSAMGEAGRDIAEQWSEDSEKYQAAEFSSTWRSIKSDGGITAGTLYHEAKLAGWTGKPEMRKSPKPKLEPREPQKPPTSDYALSIWQRFKPEPFQSLDSLVSGHAYAKSKGINWAAGASRGAVSGALVGKHADCIVIPLRTYPGGALCGVECINSEGKKQTFGQKGVLILGNDLDPGLPQLVCEGWATSVEHFRLFEGNICVYVAGSKQLMPKVAKAVADHTGRKVIQRGEIDE